MSRAVTATFQTSAEAGHVRAAIFVQLDFSAGYTRLCNAGQTLKWNGYDWQGAGRMLALSTAEESDALEAKTIDITLSGVDDALVTLAQTTHYQGRPVDIWLAPLDESYVPIADPFAFFSGKMDFCTFDLLASTITLRCNTWFEDWQRPRMRRYTGADQQAEYSGDRFMEFAESMADMQLVWG